LVGDGRFGDEGEAAVGEGAVVWWWSWQGGCSFGIGVMDEANESGGRTGYGHSLIADLPQVAEDWEQARYRTASSVRQREAALRQAGRRLRTARDGMDRQRWEQILDRSAKPRSSRDSQAVFRVIRLLPLVEAVEADIAAIEAGSRAATDEAWATLRESTRDLLRYGPIAEAITGLPLQTLARIASTPGLSGTLGGVAPGPACRWEIASARSRRRTKMPSKDTVKSYQAALARYVADHDRAASRLEQAMSRRAEILAAQDEAVAAAREVVQQTVISMAHALGPDLTAGLLELDVTDVRRLSRSAGHTRATL